jgi:hypothetical protein
MSGVCAMAEINVLKDLKLPPEIVRDSLFQAEWV